MENASVCIDHCIFMDVKTHEDHIYYRLAISKVQWNSLQLDYAITTSPVALALTCSMYLRKGKGFDEQMFGKDLVMKLIQIQVLEGLRISRKNEEG